MGRDSKKGRNKELGRSAARRRAERRRQRTRRITAALVVAGMVVALGIGGVVALIASGSKSSKARSAPTPGTPAPTSPTASPQATTCSSQAPTVAPAKYLGTAPPKMTIDRNKNYVATLNTSCGYVKIDLFPKQAPITVNNFIFLAEKKHWYNATVFGRIANSIDIIQAGDPRCSSSIGTGTFDPQCGTGGPGYAIKHEYPNGLSYRVGTVAMARESGKPDSAGSQFFIITGPKGLSLPPNYTIFGQVEKSSLSVIKKIQSVPAGGPSGETPLQKVWIYGVRVNVKK